MEPHDRRVDKWNGNGNRNRNAGRRRRAQARRRFVIAALFVLAWVGTIYYILHDDVGKDMVATVGKKLSRQVKGDPVHTVSDEGAEPAGQDADVPLVAIDAGHGGVDNGSSRKGVMEKEVNLEIAVRLSEKLQDMGYQTLMIREDNETAIPKRERVEMANAAEADIYISIHQNTYQENDNEVSGVETWYCGDSEGSLQLAQLVHDSIIEKTGARSRDLQESDELYVVREAAMPSCLVEASFLTNRAEREAIVTAEYQEKLAEGMAEGIQKFLNAAGVALPTPTPTHESKADTKTKTMYLTFDDGPSEENTSRVLDILKERDIKATFFVVGENVRRHPEVARRIAEEGHTIGIHCNRHVYEELYESVDSYLEDFQAAYDAVYEVTGVEVKLFRFPGGSINAYNKEIYKELIAEMTERGFIYFDWNASLEDAMHDATQEELIQNAVESTHGWSTVVMLAHDIIYDTSQILGELIDSLPEYKMEPLTPEVKPVQFRDDK